MKKNLTKISIIIGGIFLLGLAIYAIDKELGIGLFDNIKNRIANVSSDTGNNMQVDTTPLEVKIEHTNITTLEHNTSLTVVSNKAINIDESSKFKLTYVSERDGKMYYVLEIFNIGIGFANTNITIKDEAENKKDFTLSITREEYALPFGLDEIQDWEGSKYTVDGNNLLAKVDKNNKLVEDYEPTDLVDLNKNKLLYTNAIGIMLRDEAADYLSLMLKDLYQAKNKNVVIASGYRSILNQYSQYASWVKELGQEEADKVSARPGYSEHSLGTSVDFMSQDSGFVFTNDFDKTEAGLWLKENSYRYGFVQSYPEGKELTTGYNYEAWHYRYIGIQNASKLKESGLTLKEWLSIEE